MRRLFQLMLAAAVLAFASAGTRAQQYSGTNVFTFAPAPAPGDLSVIPRADIDAKLGARAELKLRPNTATELYLWVLNPKEDEQEFTIELIGPRESFTLRTKATIPGNSWKRVRLPKPAPPAAPTTPPLPAAPAATPVPAEPPPPPGAKLALSGGESKLTFRLLNAKGDPEKDLGGKHYGRDFPVSILAPTEYVGTPVTKITPGKGYVSLNMTVTQKPFPFPGTANVQLSFPPQESLKNSFIRDGFYRRNLILDPRAEFNAANPAPTITLTGEIENPGEKVRVYVGVDGISRAFAYTLSTLGKTADTQILPETKSAVRVARGALPAVTKPIGKYPVLVEVDNPSADDTLELRIRPAGKGAELTERVPLDSIRDLAIWLDTAGPTDAGLLFTTVSRDWVKPLDLSHLQGKVEVLGVLKTKAGEVLSESPLVLTVDGTPPERITFLPIEPTLQKGKPLELAATVNDPDTSVTKATFFLCKQLDEGKMPPDAIKAVGTQSEKNPKVWSADLKVPEDFRGVGLVGVVFTNQAGIINDPPQVQRVEIVEAGPPTGNITGKIEYGDRPQPGVAVSLRDVDGKEKSATTTNDKGVFTFSKVPVGSYKVVGIKKDSSTGAAGIAPVQVGVEHTAAKPAKVVVTLNKIRQ